MPDFEIRTDTVSLAEKRAAKRKSKLPGLVIAAVSAACVVLVILIVATLMRGGGQPADPLAEQATGQAPANRSPNESRATSEPDHVEPAEPALVEDDGKTMWVSPTAGPPIDLAGLPMGCEMFLAMRPADLMATPEGEKWLAALGPRGGQAEHYLEHQTGLTFREIDQLLIGVRPTGEFATELTLVVTPREGASQRLSSQHYLLVGREPTFVIASPNALAEIKELKGAAPPLRREVELVVGSTDSSRHVTLVAAPAFLFGEGRSMWQGALAGLRDPLFNLLPDSTRCAAVSLHAGDDFFAEVRLAATIDQKPWTFANQFADKIASWPAEAERAIAGITATSYSAAVVARLPAMLRTLSRYQRVGADNDQALLRVYLPAPAGHNLLMAGELLLSETMAAGGASTPQVAGNQPPAQSIEERLAQRTSLSFARDTLETAVQLLGDDIGVDIVLMGGDLQLDGITKNQSFGLDEQDKPAAEILVSILRLANPDKTASGPDDPKQKLVYVLGTRPGSIDPAVLVTTRAQAEKRGDELPEIFVPK
ncbi:hypothetical protein [Aeoliella mucimassa]|uniref:Uncharacterized protein n=1 Tax=Aeoliella mucimassa TaxID=2527972 RepID=A0A518AKA6_9BACT|nr:hypothetical protein [Aeoliella mucimassa]QDU55161.1 hypothetical protein Pan181_13470 [Aeoliella mucimassa]